MDQTQIYNLALSACGTRDSVSSPTEESREAEICNLWFPIVRDHVLSAAWWPSTRATARLALLSTRDDTLAWASTDPEPGFMYAYAAPSDMLYPRNMYSYGRFVTSVYGDQAALMTQDENALFAYTKRQTNVGLWPASLQLAIAYALSAFIAMPLHGKPSRAAQAQQMANELINQARVSAANSDDTQLDTIPDWIEARGYAGSAPDRRYFYPYGPLISVTEMQGVS